MRDPDSKLPKALNISFGAAAKPSVTSLERRKSVVIGRGLDCDIVIKDAKASRRHCRLTRGESSFILEDLDSRNGTYVDGERINAPVTLKANQTFKIGDTMFYLT